MSSGRRERPDDAVDAAIGAVLAAEREARASLEGALRDADAIEELARERVRRLQARTDARVLALRCAFAARREGELARVRDEDAALGDAPALDDTDLALLERALAALAAELTGGTP